MECRLEKVWINESKPGTSDEAPSSPPLIEHQESSDSQVSLGDTHIWRENGDENV